MAFLGQDNKQLDDPNQQQQQGGAAQPGSSMVSGSGTTPLVGTGTNAVSASTSSAQPAAGAGGSGWTNIQSYLTANQGDTGSSNMLSKNVGSQFAQDQSDIQKQSDQTTDQANQFTKNNFVAPDQASQMISQMAVPGYDSNQAQQYYNQFGNALQQYQGPKSGSFTPGLSAQTQNYGTALGNDDATNAMMQNFYAQANGGVGLTQGQSGLQSLLTANDPNFQQSKQNLLAQYAGLNPWLQNEVSQTNQGLQSAENQFNQNKSALQGYLNTSSAQDQTQMQQAADAWNQGESAIQSGQNKALASGGPTGMIYGSPGEYGNSGSNYYAFANGKLPPAGHVLMPNGKDIALDASKYYDIYNPGQQANVNNIGGVDNQRNQFNVMAHILGQPSIEAQTPVTHGNWSFDQDAFNKAWQNLQLQNPDPHWAK